jgi:hypothetical protein
MVPLMALDAESGMREVLCAIAVRASVAQQAAAIRAGGFGHVAEADEYAGAYLRDVSTGTETKLAI